MEGGIPVGIIYNNKIIKYYLNTSSGCWEESYAVLVTPLPKKLPLERCLKEEALRVLAWPINSTIFIMTNDCYALGTALTHAPYIISGAAHQNASISTSICSPGGTTTGVSYVKVRMNSLRLHRATCRLTTNLL